jgi:hypothetical protein
MATRIEAVEHPRKYTTVDKKRSRIVYHDAARNLLNMATLTCVSCLYDATLLPLNNQLVDGFGNWIQVGT